MSASGASVSVSSANEPFCKEPNMKHAQRSHDTCAGMGTCNSNESQTSSASSPFRPISHGGHPSPVELMSSCSRSETNYSGKISNLDQSELRDDLTGFELNESVDQLTKVRKLSSSEFTMKQAMDIGISTVGDMLQFRTKEPLSYHEISECLEMLQEKYEMLQVNTVRDENTGKFYWARLPKNQVYIAANLGILSELAAQKRFNEIVKLGIKDGEPIWRFYFGEIEPICDSNANYADVILAEADDCDFVSFRFRYCVCFVMSHALVDGIGIANIIADFFTIVCTKLNLKQDMKWKDAVSQSAAADKCRHVLCLQQHVPISPPYEELVPNIGLYRVLSLPLSLMFGRVLKTCLTLNKMPFINHPIFKSPNLKPIMLQNPNAAVGCGTELIRFSVGQWGAFQQFRRKHGLTVSGLGLALFGTAMMKYAYGDTQWPTTTTLAAHILRDPRRYFKETELDRRALVANYIASGLIVILPFFSSRRKKKEEEKRAQGSHHQQQQQGRDMHKLIVDTARLVTQQIRGNVKNFQTFFYGEVQRRISKDTQLVHDFVSAFSSHPRPCGRLCMIQFSNIGHVCCTDQQSCGDFDAICVEKSIALADQSKSGDCFCNVLMTLQGQLHWTISYPTHLYSQQTVHAIAQQLSRLWVDVIGTAAAAAASSPAADEESPSRPTTREDTLDQVAVEVEGEKKKPGDTNSGKHIPSEQHFSGNRNDHVHNSNHCNDIASSSTST